MRKILVFFICLCIVYYSHAQNIQLPAGIPLTVEGDLNLSPGRSIKLNNINFLRSPGTANTFVGQLAGSINQTGSHNTFVGDVAGVSNTTAMANVFIGHAAGYANNTGADNTFIGTQAGGLNTSGRSNVFLGKAAGFNNKASGFNTFVGYAAGFTNAAGQYNSYLGEMAGYYNTDGGSNVFLGRAAGYANTTGSENTYVGTQAGNVNTIGNFNTVVGRLAGAANVSGSSNTFLGYKADATGVNKANLTNATAIGANTFVSVSNAVVLGNNANIGIGTDAPAARLHVVSGVANQSGLRLSNLTSMSPAALKSQTKFLAVDNNGNVVMASINNSSRVAADTSNNFFWRQKESHIINGNKGGVIIGSDTQTPEGYKLYVSDGILTEKVVVALKNTNEWRDNVFASGYPIKKLSEVEQFIQRYKHLPNLPSAEEMVRHGLDVAQITAQLVETIEVQTLYSIEQEKRIEQQNLKIQNLEKKLQVVLNHIQQRPSKSIGINQKVVRHKKPHASQKLSSTIMHNGN
ncbi:hypothetical protein GCM10027299_12840 [Larkinella ripae]